jgi:hypothetical protein
LAQTIESTNPWQHWNYIVQWKAKGGTSRTLQICYVVVARKRTCTWSIIVGNWPKQLKTPTHDNSEIIQLNVQFGEILKGNVGKFYVGTL